MDNNRNSILAVALIAVLMSAALIGAVALVNSSSNTQTSNYTSSDLVPVIENEAAIAKSDAMVADTSSSVRLCEALQSILVISEDETDDVQAQAKQAAKAQYATIEADAMEVSFAIMGESQDELVSVDAVPDVLVGEAQMQIAEKSVEIAPVIKG